eukprot:CAMPEP_0177654562 /NCGR_PEP_ID=MMETSP0447-20121125/14407_1 /TAXON_ID=0 /ORGANISM="Stygamoeba regulata, Strain BSH-02190019" /LENGTH=360 /DNA_ID=CAMNT_0019158237 /DNA_START=207 /DNA_END=1286 /DNA_ORIENTATION=+
MICKNLPPSDVEKLRHVCTVFLQLIQDNPFIRLEANAWKNITMGVVPSCFFPKMDMKNAGSLLKLMKLQMTTGKDCACFLLRPSSTPGCITISILYKNKVGHYRLQPAVDGKAPFAVMCPSNCLGIPKGRVLLPDLIKTLKSKGLNCLDYNKDTCGSLTCAVLSDEDIGLLPKNLTSCDQLWMTSKYPLLCMMKDDPNRSNHMKKCVISFSPEGALNILVELVTDKGDYEQIICAPSMTEERDLLVFEWKGITPGHFWTDHKSHLENAKWPLCDFLSYLEKQGIIPCPFVLHELENQPSFPSDHELKKRKDHMGLRSLTVVPSSGDVEQYWVALGKIEQCLRDATTSQDIPIGLRNFLKW